MKLPVCTAVAAVCLALGSLVVAVAQEAPAAAGQPTQAPARPAGPAPTNLKVLPKETTGADVIKVMRGFTGGLGVECEYCHAQNAQTKRPDFASDANPMKDTARYMMTMTADLNDKYLQDLPGRRYGDPITCGTCHQGHSHPQVFVPAPRQATGCATCSGRWTSRALCGPLRRTATWCFR